MPSRSAFFYPWSGVGTTVVPTFIDLSAKHRQAGYFNPIKNPSNRKKRFAKNPLSAAAFGQNNTLKLCQNNVVINTTIERIKAHRVVLVPQDSTTLNYSTHPMTEGLGPINNKADKAVGLPLHDTLAFTERGTPLGILDAQCWARNPQDKGKSHRRKELPMEQKESIKWLRSFQKTAQVQKLCPETMLVVMGDRESDIYELFLEASQATDGPKLLVRAERSHHRKVEQELLWDFFYLIL